LHVPSRLGRRRRLPFYALAHWRTREGAREFFERWEIEAEPGGVSIVLDGDVGLVPLGGD
jgi:hypothetical protein